MGKNSETLFQRAQETIPGGVNSPVRAFKGVGGSPLFIEQALGSRIFDADNVQYIDCVGSWGPMILGHGHRYVVEAVKKAATRGFSFGAPTLGEIELAEMIVQAIPSIEMVAVMVATDPNTRSDGARYGRRTGFGFADDGAVPAESDMRYRSLDRRFRAS